MNEEMCIKKLKEANNTYFEKYFMNYDIGSAVCEGMTDGLKALLKAYTKFVFLENSIQTIKNNKKYWNNIDIQTKSIIKFTFKGVKKINKVIQNVLVPISKDISSNKIYKR